MFTSPVFLVCSVLATLWAAVFHLLFGKRLVDLALYWFVGLIGFGVGQALAGIFDYRLLILGQVHVVEGSVACWIAMLVARYLKV